MSDGLQEYLFPFFAVGSIVIDPYDGAAYSSADLFELANQLKSAVTEIRSKDESRPLGEAQKQRYFDEGRNHGLNLLPPREQSVAILERAIQLAALAYERNESLIFVGD